MSPQAATSLPPGVTHVALGDVGSTNAEAFVLARQGRRGAFWVTAERQLQGRGRRGRPWVSEKGNLYASLLLNDPAPLERLGTLPLVAALAVYKALRPFFARTPQALAIKWPNDILIDGAKVNGILLESETLPDGTMAVVIGCGINCAHHPAGTIYPATSLAECGVAVTPQDLFPVLVRAMAAEVARWDRGLGFSAIREDWLLAARGLGQAVRVNLGDRVLEGRFADLDARGYLLVEQNNGGIVTISAGDLFFASVSTS